jgi:hypothetical protein
MLRQNVVRLAVVARAAVEPNWDLPYLPLQKVANRPMSQRGTSFGTNFGGLVLGSLWEEPRLGRE